MLTEILHTLIARGDLNSVVVLVGCTAVVVLGFVKFHYSERIKTLESRVGLAISERDELRRQLKTKSRMRSARRSRTGKGGDQQDRL